MELIGRVRERKIFDQCLKSKESKLIAVLGRRRVGKTFLIRKYLQKYIRFEISGLHNGDMSDQLNHFNTTLISYESKEATLHPADSWMKAFDLLSKFINKIRSKRKKVIFLDELPWFDTPRSKFLTAFENFWNSYCTKRNDIVCVICGSAASWMIKKILNNKGGLHNRVSERIRLEQFNLYEVKQFLHHKGIKWSNYDIAQLYLTTGGVPFYLDAIRKGESVAQFVNRSCFTKNGALRDEYHILFSSLFDDSKRHYEIVNLLNNKKSGLNRSEIIKKSKLSSGGSLTKVLNELEASGFIESIVPYGAKLTKARYKLIDNFTLFYLKFMKGRRNQEWTNIVKSQTWVSWSGLAFERLCYRHISQIKKALKLEAINSEVYPWQENNVDKGAQIDMLIDRADRVINLCEIKFSKAEFKINKSYAQNLRNKIALFESLPANKRKNIFLTMITTFGVVDNEYYKELVQNIVVLDDLFWI